MNKKGFLLATSAGFAFAPMAHAADMPAPVLKAPAALPPPAPIWTGFYIGGHLGSAWQQAQNTFATSSGYFFPFSTTPTTTATGVIGGGQIGYNWQHGNYVWGIEADGSWLSGTGTATTTNTLTITEDSDTPPTVQFSVASESVSETAGTFSITVQLSAASEVDTSIPFTLGGTGREEA